MYPPGSVWEHTFSGCKVYVSGALGAERGRIAAQVERHGGECARELADDCTHAVCRVSEAFSTALPACTARVGGRWVAASLRAGFPVPPAGATLFPTIFVSRATYKADSFKLFEELTRLVRCAGARPTGVYSAMCTHVLCKQQERSFEYTLAQLDGKTPVSRLFLVDSAAAGRVLPVSRFALYSPVRSLAGIPAFAAYTFCITGLAGAERENQQLLATALGAQFQHPLTAQCTHLICAQPPRGEKYEAVGLYPELAHVRLVSSEFLFAALRMWADPGTHADSPSAGYTGLFVDPPARKQGRELLSQIRPSESRSPEAVPPKAVEFVYDCVQQQPAAGAASSQTASQSSELEEAEPLPPPRRKRMPVCHTRVSCSPADSAARDSPISAPTRPVVASDRVQAQAPASASPSDPPPSPSGSSPERAPAAQPTLSTSPESCFFLLSSVSAERRFDLHRELARLGAHVLDEYLQPEDLPPAPSQYCSQPCPGPASPARGADAGVLRPTHVIVPHGGVRRTQKILLGLASGAWIIRDTRLSGPPFPRDYETRFRLTPQSSRSGTVPESVCVARMAEERLADLLPFDAAVVAGRQSNPQLSKLLLLCAGLHTVRRETKLGGLRGAIGELGAPARRVLVVGDAKSLASKAASLGCGHLRPSELLDVCSGAMGPPPFGP